MWFRLGSATNREPGIRPASRRPPGPASLGAPPVRRPSPVPGPGAVRADGAPRARAAAMTDVAFHFNVPDKLGYACRLLRKAHAAGGSVGVVAAPKPDALVFRYIDFVMLEPQRVLAILVLHDGSVQNRVLELRRAFEPGALEQVANYLNTHFAGHPLPQVRSQLLAELRAIEFVRRLLAEGKLDARRYKNVRMHRIDGGAALAGMPASSKVTPRRATP